MRSEHEMLALILQTAQEDERIRLVLLEGSRANPQARRDCFQDFDIVYGVTEAAPFIRNLTWIRRFGELMILQLPDDMGEPPPEPTNGRYTYLMQFMDGNRIDLTILPLEQLPEWRADGACQVLLDKDGRLPGPPPVGNTYLPTLPTAREYADCCNEFWWVCPYVAKGLWRGELPYARHMLDVILREQLHKMLVWYIGVRSGFQHNPGKFGKYFQNFLPTEQWDLFRKTYADASYAHTWQALFAMTELFRQAARRVGEHCSYSYPEGDDERVSAHLHYVRQLPRRAKELYPER